MGKHRAFRVGVYFGSFDPVHENHIGLAKHALRRLDCVYIVVNPNQPSKPLLSSLRDRAALVDARLACEDCQRIHRYPARQEVNAWGRMALCQQICKTVRSLHPKSLRVDVKMYQIIGQDSFERVCHLGVIPKGLRSSMAGRTVLVFPRNVSPSPVVVPSAMGGVDVEVVTDYVDPHQGLSSTALRIAAFSREVINPPQGLHSSVWHEAIARSLYVPLLPSSDKLHVAVLGAPGSGKTATCEEVALRSRLEDFSTWLLKVGEGRIGVGTGVSDDGGSLSTVTLNGFEVRHTDMSANGITQMLAWTYGSLSDAVTGSADDAALIALFASRIVMAPLHCCVDKVNDVAIGLLRTTEWVCKSADAVEEDSDQYPITPDVLAALDPPNMPPSVLTLKQGMPVILMRNLRPEQGLCNGTRLLVRRVIDNALLEAVVLSGHRRFIGTAVTLTRIKLIEDQHSPYKWSRLAFPVKPAFSLTINKSQGQTMDRVAVCLEQPCFSHGQLYVAASRLGDPSELSFWLDSDARGETVNVVYPEALLTGATSEQGDGD